MNTTLITRLFRLGWTAYNTLEDALSMTPEMLESLKAIYSAFHGLSHLNDVTDHVHEPRICCLPDIMPAQACKWPDGHIAWDIVAEIRGLSKQQVIDGITEAFNRWSKVAGIEATYTPGNPQARILVGSRNIDGAMNILAESELPCGRPSQTHQWYDNSESWAMFDGPGQGIDFIRVATHELGHALGMNHIGNGNLLAPVYSQNIWVPQAGDIAEMQARYGKPVTPSPVPTPVPPNPTPVDGQFTIHINNGEITIDGYRITKIVQG